MGENEGGKIVDRETREIKGKGGQVKMAYSRGEIKVIWDGNSAINSFLDIEYESVGIEYVSKWRDEIINQSSYSGKLMEWK